jgi:hypothetical protein
MKSFLIASFLLVGLSLSAQSSNVKFEKRVEQMSKTYELSGTQLSSVKTILTDKMLELDKMKAERMSAEEHRIKIQEIEAKYESSLLSVFDDKQKKIYQVQKAMRQNAVRNTVETK